MTVKEYIDSHWDECIKENKEDIDTLIGLPYPYTVPAVGHFDEMYYWDTYFTNRGLGISNRWEIAKNNVDNMIYLVNEYGFMPNGNRTYYLNRSQPPFLSEMVRDVYEHYKDFSWLSNAYNALKTEYEFWMTKRNTKCGLCAYGTQIESDKIKITADDFQKRIGITVDEPDEIISMNCMAGVESGWDMNPRWDLRSYDFAHIELNSLLYLLENNMKYFASCLGNSDEKIQWQNRAKNRSELMRKYMKNEEGLFFDYDMKNNKLGQIFSIASYFPLYAKMANEEEARAAFENISRIDAPYGIVTCEKNDEKGTFQWDYPNGWACLQYIIVKGLLNYGYNEKAIEIATKFSGLIEKVFEETGNLWEKYNVVEGNVNVKNEYAKDGHKMPPMMGWSAGVYLELKEITKNYA